MSVALFQQVRIEEALASAKRAYQLWREASNPQWLDAGAWVAQLLSLKGRHREAAAMRQEVMLALQGVRDLSIFQTVTWSTGWAHVVMLNPVEARRFFFDDRGARRIVFPPALGRFRISRADGTANG